MITLSSLGLIISLTIISIRGCNKHLRDTGAVFICSENENGACYAALNLVSLATLLAASWVSFLRSFVDTRFGCIVTLSQEILPVMQMCTVAFVAVAVYSADLHGAYRPTIFHRVVGVGLSAVLMIFNVTFLSMDIAPDLFTPTVSGGIPSTDACIEVMSPTFVTSTWQRIFIDMRLMIIMLVSALLQEERNIVVVSMGD